MLMPRNFQKKKISEKYLKEEVRLHLNPSTEFPAKAQQLMQGHSLCKLSPPSGRTSWFPDMHSCSPISSRKACCVYSFYLYWQKHLFMASVNSFSLATGIFNNEKVKNNSSWQLKKRNAGEESVAKLYGKIKGASHFLCPPVPLFIWANHLLSKYLLKAYFAPSIMPAPGLQVIIRVLKEPNKEEIRRKNIKLIKLFLCTRCFSCRILVTPDKRR